MSNRIQVRISTATERDGTSEKFWSLTIADEMTPNFERLPDAELKSYALSAKDWAVVKKKNMSPRMKSVPRASCSRKSWLIAKMVLFYVPSGT